MKTRLVLFAILLGAAVAGQSAPHASKTNPLAGAWKLVSIEEPGADGKLHKAECDGMFVFTSDGKASVQVMYRNAQSGSAYTHGGYEASYGRYRVESPSAFTFHIDGALVRSLVGKDLKREYEVEGKRLTVKSADPKEQWRVIWKRYDRE